jgi:thymidine phosphorylase
VKILQGEFRSDLLELSLILAGTMIYLGGKADSIEEGIDIAAQQIKSGKAYDKFIQIVRLQGGNTKYITHPEKYPESKYIEIIKSSSDGYLKEVNTYQLGLLSAELGAGRKTKEDKIDPKAGIIFIPKIGDRIRKGDIIAELHSSSKKNIRAVRENFSDIIKFSETEVTIPKLIKKILK